MDFFPRYTNGSLKKSSSVAVQKKSVFEKSILNTNYWTIILKPVQFEPATTTIDVILIVTCGISSGKVNK